MLSLAMPHLYNSTIQEKEEVGWRGGGGGDTTANMLYVPNSCSELTAMRGTPYHTIHSSDLRAVR